LTFEAIFGIFNRIKEFRDRPLVNIIFSNASLVWGGNEKWTLRAAETLAARGHAVSIAIRDPSVWEGHVHSDKVRLVQLSFLNDVDLKTILNLRRLIRSERADIFLPTRSRDYWLGGFATWNLPAKYVMRMGITRTMQPTIKNRLRYGRFPDGIVVNAHAVKESLASHPWVDEKKIRVIYNGVDMSAELGVPARTESSSPDEFLVIGAGRVETDKGFDILIEALAIAVRQEPSIRGVIYGLGDQVESLEQLIRERNLTDKVKLGGFTKNLAGALRQADLAVSSSYREGVSNLILESWSAGCPLIATSIVGSAEIVTDGVRGRLVPPGDAKTMAAAILEAYRNPELRAKWITEGRRAIKETFNWTRMAEELENFFTELVE
jgi:glycosyltransferase involved in cell wall biosynthesis